MKASGNVIYFKLDVMHAEFEMDFVTINYVTKSKARGMLGVR